MLGLKRDKCIKNIIIWHLKQIRTKNGKEMFLTSFKVIHFLDYNFTPIKFISNF